MTVLLEMQGITKTFPGVRALDDVTLDGRARARSTRIVRRERRRQVHADEGAVGRLSRTAPTRGRSSTTAQEARFRGIRDSEAAGIVIIHQELALVPLLSIAENIFLGNERRARAASSTGARPIRRTEALLAKVGLREAPTTPGGRPGRRQAAARRDRQGAVQERAPPDPRRADRGAAGERQPDAPRPAPGAEGAGRHLDHHLATSSTRSAASPTG